MKIAVIADVHLNKSYKNLMDKEQHGVPFRTVDYMKSFEWMVDKVIEIKPDLLEITGDIFDNYGPSNKVRGFFNKQMTKLRKNNIPVIIIVGNHDACMQDHALVPLKELDIEGITVVEDPTLIKFQDINLMLMPYSIDVERGKRSLKEELLKFTKDSQEAVKGSKTMFFGHFGVRGASMSTYKNKSGAMQDFINKSSSDISIEDLDNIGAEYVFLGDYHKFQILPTQNCIAMFTGSIEKSDVSEADHKKGFVLYDSNATETKEMGKCRFIEYPNCRPILVLRGTIADMQDSFATINKDEYKGAIVKLVFKGNREEESKFSISLQDFKDKIEKALFPIYIDMERKVIDQKQEDEAKSIQEEILERGHVGDIEVLALLKEMIRERVSDEDELKKLDEMLENIHVGIKAS